jgi:hypothetical protein
MHSEGLRRDGSRGDLSVSVSKAPVKAVSVSKAPVKAVSRKAPPMAVPRRATTKAGVR